MTGTGDDGIYFYTNGTQPLTIIQQGGTIRSDGADADDYGVEIQGGAGDVTLAGSVVGGAGGAVQFDAANNRDDRLELQPGSSVTGLVQAGLGTDAFVLGGVGAQSFDISLVDADGTADAGEQFLGFETFTKEDGSTWTLTGTNDEITALAVNGGLLNVNGNMAAAAFTVNGGSLGGSGTLGSVTATAGGVVAPGNSIGTLNVAGNITFQPGSFFDVEIDAAGNSDRVAAGTATINGGTVRVLTLDPDTPTRTGSATRSSPPAAGAPGSSTA